MELELELELEPEPEPELEPELAAGVRMGGAVTVSLMEIRAESKVLLREVTWQAVIIYHP